MAYPNQTLLVSLYGLLFWKRKLDSSSENLEDILLSDADLLDNEISGWAHTSVNDLSEFSECQQRAHLPCCWLDSCE